MRSDEIIDVLDTVLLNESNEKIKVMRYDANPEEGLYFDWVEKVEKGSPVSKFISHWFGSSGILSCSLTAGKGEGEGAGKVFLMFYLVPGLLLTLPRHMQIKAGKVRAYGYETDSGMGSAGDEFQNIWQDQVDIARRGGLEGVISDPKWRELGWVGSRLLYQLHLFSH